MSGSFLFKRGNNEAMQKGAHIVHWFGTVLVNTDTWDVYFADGVTELKDLEPSCKLPEALRERHKKEPR